jgi:hypothetical protein
MADVFRDEHYREWTKMVVPSYDHDTEPYMVQGIPQSHITTRIQFLDFFNMTATMAGQYRRVQLEQSNMGLQTDHRRRLACCNRRNTADIAEYSRRSHRRKVKAFLVSWA